MSARPQILDQNGKPFQMTAYQGADRAGRELATWHPGQFSADGALLPELETLRDRTEDMIRNHGIASGAVQTHLDNIVGPGLLLDASPDRRALGLKDGERVDEMDEFENMAEAKFENYCEDNGCYIDASRRLRFSDMCAQAYRSYLTSFEIVGTAEWLKRPGTKYRTAIQMIDPARLSNPRGGFDSDRLRAGVALDQMGAPVGYWFCTHLNGDRMMSTRMQEWKYVPRETPWGRQMVLHVYDADKPGQSRGKNGIVSVLAKMKMLEKFEQATMQTAVLNSMYAAVIQSSLDWNAVGAAIGAGSDSDPTLSYLKNVTEFHKEGNVRYNGAKVMHLYPGEEFNLLSPEHPGANFASFEEATLRHIARGFNLTYEQLSGDYSKTNYSSARAAMLEAWRFFSGKQYTIAGRFATMIYQLWFEEAVELGELVLPPGLPDFYEAKSAWTRCHWIGPGRGHVDPLKEANATKVEMSMGLTNLQIEAGLRGRRWQDLIDQRAQEDRYARKRGIDPESFRGDTPVPQPPDVQEVDGNGKPIGEPEGGDGGDTTQQKGKSEPVKNAGPVVTPAAADTSGMHALAAAMVESSANQRDAAAMQPAPIIMAPTFNIHMSGDAGEDAEEVAQRTATVVAGAVTQAFAEIMSKPKRIVRDASGRPVGIEHVERIEGAA
jgi:lambda family phage portal protein